MIKNTVIALVTAAALAGAAAPAFASSLVDDTSNGFDAAYVLAQLHDKGINAASVEEWGDYVVAFVTADDGSQSRIYLTPTTLEQVAL